MNSTGSRIKRPLFDGTGVYIALFLVVTALAVAGYWTLIPHNNTADEPAGTTAPAPSVSAVIPAPDKPPATAQSAAEHRKDAAQDAKPAQSAVTLTVPSAPEAESAPESAPPAAPVPAAPSLVVSPLLGETLAAFSMDQLVYSETMADWRTHDGIDIAAEPGTQVCAASTGTVTDVRADDLMGTMVVISHDGGIDTIYANLASEPVVDIGDFVTAGQVIGSVGATALSEAALPSHLHFGVTRDGEYVDPAEYLE